MEPQDFAIGTAYEFECCTRNRKIRGMVINISSAHRVLDVKGTDGKRYSIPLDTIGYAVSLFS